MSGHTVTSHCLAPLCQQSRWMEFSGPLPEVLAVEIDVHLDDESTMCRDCDYGLATSRLPSGLGADSKAPPSLFLFFDVALKWKEIIGQLPWKQKMENNSRTYWHRKAGLLCCLGSSHIRQKGKLRGEPPPPLWMHCFVLQLVAQSVLPLGCSQILGWSPA